MVDALPHRRPPPMLDFALSAFVTLLLVIDPVGLAPAFLAATGGIGDTDKRTIALRAPQASRWSRAEGSTDLVAEGLVRGVALGVRARRVDAPVDVVRRRVHRVEPERLGAGVHHVVPRAPSSFRICR